MQPAGSPDPRNSRVWRKLSPEALDSLRGPILLRQTSSIEENWRWGAEDSSAVEEHDGASWDADWEWGAESKHQNGNTRPALPTSPICQFASLSHDANYLVCATDRLFVVLKAGQSQEYALVGKGVPEDRDEQITAVTCAPLFIPSNVKSGVSISVIVGFSSGYFRIYDERGRLLISHLLNLSPVIGIKIRTITPTSLATSIEPDGDEVLIIYGDSKAVSIDGPSVWMAIKVVAGYKDFGETLEQPALVYKKWQFDKQKRILDMVSLGPASATVISPPAFHPVSSTFLSTRRTARYIGVGRPMITFYATSEAGRSHSLKNVATKVTSAVTNAMFSFAKTIWTHTPTSLTSAYPPSTPSPPGTPTSSTPTLPDTVAPPVRMPALCTLSDTQRQITSIKLSPPCTLTGKSKLAAVTDSLGRCMLVDVEEAMVVRVFKGVRDAQCGWVQVEAGLRGGSGGRHDTPEGSRRRGKPPTLLLAIYVARGVLELYHVRHGPRVAALAVDRECKLVQTATGVLGGAYGGQGGPGTGGLAQCVLVGPTGEVRRVRPEGCF
ncbi:Rab3 GTPase-activating protein regulatory subunit N-terminus-domain-containing protein [Fimicolochytrium jonesii]|uniref:Rab3 GTPase-activating protein regulatory subunit N-terminus-domain-containing protein n=1 Tax=Fimicolochytrium jonesii TaxID=1396493 RepID=UPI0022FEDA37|nr:Rab3 GTPase-activating protein regulatory subunit N-terminus-domain-containing protein [Fimicolochytrium jonesii]KAI8822260.1 Rab3 GTPase-activating protein regulatory subunit N-terminus-domain-containing protein [Fimicolochytrium jonesii]